MAAALLALAAVTLPAPAGAAVTVWAVGDGADTGKNDDAVAARIQALGLFRFLYLGDVYDSGTAKEFATGYQPSFGRFKSISRSTPGNHDWPNHKSGYDPYWGPRAPLQPNGGHYFSSDLGSWHFVSLNSNEDTGASSPQVAWLRRDLARRRGTCTIAYWHHPRYNAGRYGDNKKLEPLWAALAGHAVIVLSGHDHNYQRLKPERGIVQFVAGTGGHGHYNVTESDPRLLASSDTTYGALALRLTRGGVISAYVQSQGATLDSSRLSCRPHTALVRIRRPRDGRVYRHGLRSLRGGLSGASRAARLTLVRRTGRRCRRFDARRFRRSSCRTRRSFRAGDLRGWRIKPLGRSGLPRGRYRLTVRVLGLNGAVASDTARFRVR